MCWRSKTATTFAGAIVLVVLSLFLTAPVASAISVTSLKQVCNKGDETGIQTVEMEIDYVNETTDNLLIRDPSTGNDTIVSGNWGLLFVNYMAGGNINLVGYAENRWRDYPDYAGFMIGNYYETLGDGRQPDDVWAFFDSAGDGFGSIDGTVWNLVPDEDFIFWSDDILFGEDQIRGDVDQLPYYIAANGGQPAILPSMIIAPEDGSPIEPSGPIPEPATMTLLGLGLAGIGLGRKRMRLG